MHVSGALVEGLRTSGRSPQVLLAALCYAVLSTASAVTAFQVLPIGWLWQVLFVAVSPFLVGALIALVAGAQRGSPSVLVSLAIGMRTSLGLVLGAVSIAALTLLTSASALALGFVSFGLGSTLIEAPPVDAWALVALALVVLVFAVGAVISAVIPWMAFQFFAAAQILEGLDVVASLKRSHSLVLANPGSVAGFTVVTAVLAALSQLPVAFVFLDALEGPAGHSGGRLAPGDVVAVGEAQTLLAVMLVTTTATVMILSTYYVAYYRRLVESAPRRDDGPGPSPNRETTARD